MERRGFIGAVGGSIGSCLAGCVGRVESRLNPRAPIEQPCGAPPGPWPTAGGDPGRSGRTDTTLPADDASAVELLSARRTDGSMRLASSLPIVVDQTLFAPAGPELVALDLTDVTTEPAWIHAFEDDIAAAPAFACGALVVAGLNHLSTLDPVSGDAYWSVEGGATTRTAVGTHGGSAVIGGPVPRVVDLHSGNTRWTGQGGDTVAIDDTGIYTTRNQNGSRGVFAHDESGDERWHLALGKIVASASVANGTVWVVDTDGRVYAIDALTGETEWSRGLPGVRKVHSGLAVADSDLVVPAGTGERSWVLDAQTGEPRWTVESGIVTGRPVVGPDWVAFGRTNHGITVYDRSTGDKRRSWSRSRYDFGTIDGFVPCEEGFIVRGGSSSGLTLLR